MRLYELVLLINPSFSKDKIDSKIDDIEEMLGTKIKEKDDMGMLDLYHPINWYSKSYFVSYLIEWEGKDVDFLKKKFRIDDSVLRYGIYKRESKEDFINYKKANKKLKKELGLENKQEDESKKEEKEADDES